MFYRKLAFTASILASTALVTPATAQTISTLEIGPKGTIQSWGAPDTSAYGQTFTVSDPTRLDTATVSIRDNGNPISFDLHVFAWSGARATGASLGQVSGITAGSADFELIEIGSIGADLNAAGEYVFFLQATSNGSSSWQTVDGTSYADGNFVYQNNGGNTDQWTTVNWTSSSLNDLAFSLVFNLPALIQNQLADLAAASSAMGRFAVQNAQQTMRLRGQESLTTRSKAGAIAGVTDANPEASVLRYKQTTTGMMDNLYTWIDLTGFRAEDNDADRTYSGQGLQVGADLAITPDMVLGLSIGVQDLSSSVGTVRHEGVLRFVQPYLAYRSGAWAGEASLIYGEGTFDQSALGGEGSGETYLSAFTFNGGYSIEMNPALTLTPSLGFVRGSEHIRGVSGTLDGTGTETVTFTQVSLGAEVRQTMSRGEIFGGLYADWLETSSDTRLVSDMLVDDGWTGRLALGAATQIADGVTLEASVEFGGLGGDLRNTSGGLSLAYQF